MVFIAQFLTVHVYPTPRLILYTALYMSTTSQRTILVAEDEKPMAHALELKLTHAGYKVLVAYDGEEAIQKAQQEPIHLMLLDLIMPKKDGFAVLEELNKKKHTFPIIVASNLSQPGDEERARALGAKEYIIKSNTPIAHILELVQQHLG